MPHAHFWDGDTYGINAENRGAIFLTEALIW